MLGRELSLTWNQALDLGWLFCTRYVSMVKSLKCSYPRFPTTTCKMGT